MNQPVCIRLIDMDNELGVAVEDIDGIHQGILVYSQLRPILERLLPTSTNRFVRFWQSYAETRGGDAFFEDLTRFADAAASSPGILDVIGRLTKEGDADQWFHNAYQAQLMSAAYGRFGNAAPDRRPTGRIADIVVRLPGVEMRYEVKALLTLATVELVDEGFQVSRRSIDQAQRVIKDKVIDGAAQVGVSGSIIVPVWCNHIGQLFSNHAGTRQVSLADAMEPSSVVLGCRTSDGRDVWIRFARSTWPDDFDAFIEATRGKPVLESIPLSGGSIGFTNATEYTSLGRIIRIDNRKDRYGEDEQVDLKSHVMMGIPTPDLRTLSDLLGRGRSFQEAFERASAAKPIETGSYNAQQMVTDERFSTLFAWARSVAEPLSALLRLGLLRTSSSTRIANDIRSLAPSFTMLPESLSFDSSGVPAIGGLLTTRYCIPRLKRLTGLAQDLVNKEVERRAAEPSD